MKRRMLIAILALLALPALAEPSTTKLLYRDYGVTDSHKVGALSMGVASWTDDDNDFGVGGYFDFKGIMLWDELLNLGIGFVAKPPPADAHYRLDLRLETSVSTHLFNCLELGVWYAPFWGLAGKDDPYGVMVGYVFKF